jgi:hypothetical protein
MIAHEAEGLGSLVDSLVAGGSLNDVRPEVQSLREERSLGALMTSRELREP